MLYRVSLNIITCFTLPHLCEASHNVGKTTTCANLGIGLARHGKKVLLIDTDPQGSLTASLGYPQPDKLPVTLATVMGRVLNETPPVTDEGILRHFESVDLLPANIELSGIANLLLSRSRL